jgi:aminoglycoside phosphotransferase (APT) family kinase protein
MPELAVQELLDRATLAADVRWPGAAITDLEPLPGGISSLTFAARLTEGPGRTRRVVLKVAPPGLEPVRNRDVLRQARFMRAVREIDGVLVPEVLLEDAGSPPFFIMEFVDGQAYEPYKDVSAAPPEPATVRERARAAARLLAKLHQPAPALVGLDDEPVLGPEQELERWATLFATAGDDLRGRESELHRRLIERIPAPMAARVLHGDYRLGNIQFAGPRPAAIIDWEISSLGDPRSDLAWLMAFCDPVQRFALDRDAANQAAAAALPVGDELLAEYLSVRPIETAGLSWFLAACYYKIAATTAAIAKRNRRRPEPDASLEVAAGDIPAVIERGLELVPGTVGVPQAG